jgi:hypothetical protein
MIGGLSRWPVLFFMTVYSADIVASESCSHLFSTFIGKSTQVWKLEQPLQNGQVVFDTQLGTIPLLALFTDGRYVLNNHMQGIARGNGAEDYWFFLTLHKPMAYFKEALASGEMSFSDYVIYMHYRKKEYSAAGWIYSDFQNSRGLSTWSRDGGFIFVEKVVEEILSSEFSYDRHSGLFDSKPSIEAFSRFLENNNQNGSPLQIPILAQAHSRDSSIRTEVIDQLLKSQVGGKDGAADREIVADILLSRNESNGPPTFVTADQGIVRGLLALKFGGIHQGGIALTKIKQREQMIHPDMSVTRATEGYYPIKVGSEYNHRGGPQGQMIFKATITDINLTDSDGNTHSMNVVYYFSDSSWNWIYPRNHPVW